MNNIRERKVNYEGSEEDRNILAEAHSLLMYGIYIRPEDLALNLSLINEGIEVRPVVGDIEDVRPYNLKDAKIKQEDDYVQVKLKDYKCGFTIFYHPKSK